MKWIKIFASSEQAMETVKENKPFTVSLSGTLICLVRMEGRFSAFKAFCPHAGASLSDGFVNPYGEIVCPLHGYRFSLRDGREKSGHSCELSLYSVEIREEGVFLGIR